MAFSFLGLKKNKDESNQTHLYAIKELQKFFLEKISSQPDTYYYRQYLKKDLPNDSISEIIVHAWGHIPLSSLSCDPLSEKYGDKLSLNIEQFFKSLGKDALDELVIDMKALFDENSLISLYASGKWKFPCYELYETCAKAGIKSIDNDFARQKVMTIANSILKDAGVPSQYYSLYVNQEILDEIFQNGMEKYKVKEAEKEAEQRKPLQGKLSETEYQHIELSQSLHPLFGIEKRIYMIEDAIQRINKKITDYKKGQEAIKELGIILGTSVKQEKKKDWALLGGIAEGIAGPGAGIAVAGNAIAENIAIEQRNALARQAANQTIQSIYSGASNLYTDIFELEKEESLMLEHLQDAKTKVVMEQYTTDKIFKSLTITSSVEKLASGNGLKLTVTVKNNFKADVPADVQVAVDGTLSATIYFEDVLLDTVCVYLPLFGVSDHETLTMYTDFYVEAEGAYSVEVEPNNLWIVEV